MVLSVLAALAEPTRLEAMRLLDDGSEHCVCELMRRSAPRRAACRATCRC